MKSESKNPRDRRSLGHALMVWALGFVLCAQPGFAQATNGLLVRPCAPQDADCCCAPPVVEAPVLTSCCSSAAETDEVPVGSLASDPEADGCGCRLEFPPTPSPEPAFVEAHQDPLARSVLARWLHGHAVHSASTPMGPPDPYGSSVPPWGVGPLRPDRLCSNRAPGTYGDGAWSLVKRGVPGLLAVLAVSRV